MPGHFQKFVPLCALLLISGVDRAVATASETKTILRFDANEQQSEPLTPQADPASPDREGVRLAAAAEETPPSPEMSAPTIAEEQVRQLAAPSEASIAAQTKDAASQNRPKLPFRGPQLDSLGTAGAGLAVVVGLFLICMWLLKLGRPRGNSLLPPESVALLGKIPLTAKTMAHLLQVGNKLVLISISPEGVAPITEITDPTEVNRIQGICLRNQQHSSSREFQQVLEQMAGEPTRGFLGSSTSFGFSKGGRTAS